MGGGEGGKEKQKEKKTNFKGVEEEEGGRSKYFFGTSFLFCICWLIMYTNLLTVTPCALDTP